MPPPDAIFARMSGHPKPVSQLRIDLAGWLNDFALPDRTNGRHDYARGNVVALEVFSEPKITTAFASVRGTRDYNCTFTYLVGGGWDGECSCPVGDACKHLYATGTALLDRLAAETLDPFGSGSGSTSADFRRAAETPADETSLVAQFTSATSKPPDRKQLTFLRNLLALHRSLEGTRYFDYQALQALLPASNRHADFNYYRNPFHERWSRPPATPLELWSHIALLFVEGQISLPPFMAKVTDLAWAKTAVTAYQRERDLAAWRKRFASLENAILSSAEAADSPPALRTFRLRLARKKAVWEISDSTTLSPEPASASASPSARPLRTFEPLNASGLRLLLNSAEDTTFALEPASASLAVILRAHQISTGRTSLNLTHSGDCEFLARLLSHPLARTCITDHDGNPIIRDPRRLVWQFRDHPTDPELALAQLAFADGTPAPAPLVHLPAKPDLYLHGATLFSGMPPPPANSKDVVAPVAIPRAALALPEAGRFAARARVSLPSDTAGRFRSESLHPRLRAYLAPRRSEAAAGDDVLLVELGALSPDGILRALYQNGTWRQSGPGLPPPSPDSAFLLLDFNPTRDAVSHFHQLAQVNDAHHPNGARLQVEIGSPHFPEVFSSWLSGFPPQTLIELSPELAAFAQAPTRAHFAIDLTPNADTGIDWFDIRVTLRAEDTTLTLEDIAILHHARGRFVRLAGHGWRRLTLDDSTATQEKLARLGLDPEAAVTDPGRDPLRFHALQLADDALRDVLPEKLWNQVRDRAASLRACVMPPIPPGLVADLRPYQHEGFHFLAFLSENNFGGILADDMGLGKTLQTLAWFLWLADRTAANHAASKSVSVTPKRTVGSSEPNGSLQRKRVPANRPFRALVICPKSVVVNWQLETARFAPAIATTVFTSALVSQPAAPSGSSARVQSEGVTLEPLAGRDASRPHILIANYTQLRLHAAALASEKWDAVVLDEGQNIKNPVSATAQAARALPTSHRLVLTGTPVENRLLDLWSLFSFAQPGLLGGQTSFKRLYNDKADPTGARTRLAQRVKHFLLRRTKSQVARDLPPRIEEELVVELEGEQRRLYDAELKHTRALLLGVKSNRDFDNQRFNILQSLLRLRQICCDPRLLQQTPKDVQVAGTSSKSARVSARARSSPKSTVIDSGGSESALANAEAESAASPQSLPIPGAKLEALLDTLEPLISEGHKVLVFSQFVKMLDLIRIELTARGIRHLLLTGQTENRQNLVDQFQADPEIPVFLLSLKAAGSGLNLTAASYVVLFDPWWNPAVEAQAIDRTHRIGQRNQVIAYRLIARNTIEEKIRALQREKAALAAAVVQEESLAVVLDLDSLRHILA